MNNPNIQVKVNGPQALSDALRNYGTIILKPNVQDNRNVLTQDMMSKRNTKYVIQWNYDLLGETITIPEGCMIEFNGGTITNGTIVGNNTILLYDKNIDEICTANREGTFIYNTTVADEEDITSETGQLKFKDRPTTNGMGKKILRKNIVDGVNILTQNMINQANTIYVIRYDFTLGENIIIPANCVLEFDGGSLSNGTLIINHTNSIIWDGNVIFNNVLILTNLNQALWSDSTEFHFDDVMKMVGDSNMFSSNTSDDTILRSLSAFETIVLNKDFNLEAQENIGRGAVIRRTKKSLDIYGNGHTINYNYSDATSELESCISISCADNMCVGAILKIFDLNINVTCDEAVSGGNGGTYTGRSCLYVYHGASLDCKNVNINSCGACVLAYGAPREGDGFKQRYLSLYNCSFKGDFFVIEGNFHKWMIKNSTLSHLSNASGGFGFDLLSTNLEVDIEIDDCDFFGGIEIGEGAANVYINNSRLAVLTSVGRRIGISETEILDTNVFIENCQFVYEVASGVNIFANYNGIKNLVIKNCIFPKMISSDNITINNTENTIIDGLTILSNSSSYPINMGTTFNSLILKNVVSYQSSFIFDIMTPSSITSAEIKSKCMFNNIKLIGARDGIVMVRDRKSSTTQTPIWYGYSIGSTANRCLWITSLCQGQFYYDVTINKPIWWNGSAWVDATGATV